ncbi:MAG TPA: hypothetical protein VL486_07985 [Verrucomicrobiae bacterium]|nr:hypothetical protein [Verrucomicrobiae bacterium]
MAFRTNEAVCAVVLSLSMACGAYAQDNKSMVWGATSQDNKDLQALAEDNAKLRNRVETLENELSDIKKALGKSAEPKAAVLPEPKAAVTPGPKAAVPTEPPVAVPAGSKAAEAKAPAAWGFTDAEVAQLKKLVDSKKKPVMSSIDFELYGYIKLDLAHDSDRTSAGNYARWVESEELIKNHDEFSMTARQTRLGLKATGPTVGKMHSSALVEIDFYNGGDENKNLPMLRHAYMNLDWPEDKFSILAGQTCDVISPLWMPTLNYTVGWWQGNIGYRRPQLRLTKGFDLTEDVGLKLEAAATRDIGRVNSFAYSDTGQDSSIPGLQGRTSLTFPGFHGKPTTIGVSGHWAQEQINHTNTFANPQHADSWSANLDVTVPVTPWLSFAGEAFTGRDLDMYLGGIAQGFDTTRGKGIRSDGLWGALTLKPTPKWLFNVGGGFDKVPEGDVSAASARTFNSVIFGNAQYAFTANFTLGLEISHLRTEYKEQKDGDAWREQMSLIYKF